MARKEGGCVPQLGELGFPEVQVCASMNGFFFNLILVLGLGPWERLLNSNEYVY